MSAPTPPPVVDPVRAHPHPEPTLYPLVLRTWTFAWWRPLVGLLVMLVSMLLFLPLVLLPVLAIGIAIQGGDFSHEFTEALDQTKITPAAMLYINLTLAGLVLASWFVVRFVHRLRPRWLMSVRPGIRWRFFLVCLGLSIVAIIAQLIVGALIPGDVDAPGSHLVHWTGETYALALVVLLTTPLQAMGEEYAFRGYAMQAFGSLTGFFTHNWDRARQERWAVTVAIVASAGLFALAHGVQNFPLFFDRFAFGLLAGYLVYRTGGLEAGIALHIWNNLIAFGFGIAYGEVHKQLTETTASWWNLPLTVTQNGIYLILVLLVARRMGLDNRTRPPVLVDQTAPV
jgi:membrane protease YdiL (CAAX protease family)